MARRGALTADFSGTYPSDAGSSTERLFSSWREAWSVIRRLASMSTSTQLLCAIVGRPRTLVQIRVRRGALGRWEADTCAPPGKHIAAILISLGASKDESDGEDDTMNPLRHMQRQRQRQNQSLFMTLEATISQGRYELAPLLTKILEDGPSHHSLRRWPEWIDSLLTVLMRPTTLPTRTQHAACRSWDSRGQIDKARYTRRPIP